MDVSEPGDVRRLAAIMFTDIVGYTALAERDEEAAVRVRERHRGLLRSLVEKFEGEVVEAPGDESLSIFPSALMAADCALALQAALRGDPDLSVRIGIHLGDVVRRQGEIIGDAVNVAARIRPLARPGGVCISEPVWRQLRGRSHLRARSLGRTRLKNVSEPIEALELEGATPAPDRRSTPRRRIGAIAAGAALALGVGYAVYASNRDVVLASVALYTPLVFGGSIEQELGFTTTRDGVRIAYATTGAGPPIVIVLGWATHLEEGISSPLYDREGLIPMTSQRHLLVRYDGRGCGLSDRDVAHIGLEERVLDLEAVVEALELERFAVYGMSSGSQAAIRYVAEHPDRVTRLVLAGPFLSVDLLGEQRKELLSKALPFIETDWEQPAVTNLFTEIMFPRWNDVVRRVSGEFFRRSAHGPQMAAYGRGMFEIDFAELSDVAARIQVPSLVLHARGDATAPLEAGRQLASRIPGARFEIVDGDHTESIGGTAETRATILDFLDEDLEGPAQSP